MAISTKPKKGILFLRNNIILKEVIAVKVDADTVLTDMIKKQTLSKRNNLL